MKFLRYFIISIFTIAIFSGYLFANDEQECLSYPIKYRQPYPYILYPSANPTVQISKSNKLLSVAFNTIDTVANVLSYYSYFDNKSFDYNSDFNTLLTIHRGAIDPDTFPNYTGIDLKDNYFINSSTDFGKTWKSKVLVYDYKKQQYNKGRYPSIASFKQDQNLDRKSVV